jgi:hypothetical protein
VALRLDVVGLAYHVGSGNGTVGTYIAELSTTGAFAACMSCLLCRGWCSCGPAQGDGRGSAVPARAPPTETVTFMKLIR